jgi:hypothetical protein
MQAKALHIIMPPNACKLPNVTPTRPSSEASELPCQVHTGCCRGEASRSPAGLHRTTSPSSAHRRRTLPYEKSHIVSQEAASPPYAVLTTWLRRRCGSRRTAWSVGKIEIASSAPARADKASQVRQASGTWQPSAKSGGRLASLDKARQHCKAGAVLSGCLALVSSDKPSATRPQNRIYIVVTVATMVDTDFSLNFNVLYQ